MSPEDAGEAAEKEGAVKVVKTLNPSGYKGVIKRASTAEGGATYSAEWHPCASDAKRLGKTTLRFGMWSHPEHAALVIARESKRVLEEADAAEAAAAEAEAAAAAAMVAAAAALQSAMPAAAATVPVAGCDPQGPSAREEVSGAAASSLNLQCLADVAGCKAPVDPRLAQGRRGDPQHPLRDRADLAAQDGAE